MLFLVVPIYALGFSGIGPVAGSIAAGWQATLGVGLVFSTLQSAAMGGYGVAAVTIGTTAVFGGGAAAAAVAGIVHAVNKNKKDYAKDDDKDGGSDVEDKDKGEEDGEKDNKEVEDKDGGN